MLTPIIGPAIGPLLPIGPLRPTPVGTPEALTPPTPPGRVLPSVGIPGIDEVGDMLSTMTKQFDPMRTVASKAAKIYTAVSRLPPE